MVMQVRCVCKAEGLLACCRCDLVLLPVSHQLRLLQAGPEQHSYAYDGYEASLSERHSDATSDTTQPEPGAGLNKPNSRALTLSPSLRSSAASTDDMLSPILAQRLTNFSHSFYSHTGVQQADLPADVQSSFSDSALPDVAAAAGQLSDPRSPYSGSATAGHADARLPFGAQWGLLGGRLQQGFGHIGQSLSGGFGGEPHPRTLSPELGMAAS